MNFEFATLERRISALEAAQSCSLRFGRVVEICEDEKKRGKVRVQLRDGQSMVSHTISTVQKRVLKDQDIQLPDINEPVVCLFSGQGCEEGVVLGAYYSEREKAPEQPPSHMYKKFNDGAEMYYDREGHEMKIVLPAGSRLYLECGPNTVEMDDSGIRIKGPRIDLN